MQRLRRRGTLHGYHVLPPVPSGFRLCIDAARLLAIVRLTGDVTGDDLVEAAICLQGHPDWDARCDVIWDYRAIETFVILPDDVPAIFHARTRDSTGRDVILVKRDLEYAIARLYAHRAQEVGKEVQLCWQMKEVLAFLGLPRLPDQLRRCTDSPRPA